VPSRPVAAPIQPRAVPSGAPISAAASAGSTSAQQGSPSGSGSAGRVPPSFAAPPSGPPPSGPSRPVPPAQPPRPTFDWESLVGVKLFSWIAGAALALAAVFFLRYSMDHGWLRPEIRMVIGLLTGVGLLVGCELKVARSYSTTANALDAS